MLSALNAKQGLSLRQPLLVDSVTEGTFSTRPEACGMNYMVHTCGYTNPSQWTKKYTLKFRLEPNHKAFLNHQSQDEHSRE